MKKASITLIIIFLAAGIIFFPGNNNASAEQILYIGLSAPLTGPVANVGTNFKNGTLMAIEDQNAKGGVTIGGVKYKLEAIVRDNKFDPAVGKNVAEELVYKHKVKIIIGPSMVEGPGMLPITEKEKVIMFAMSPTPDMAGPNHKLNFFVGGISEQMYSTVIDYMLKYYPKAKKVITLYADLPDAPMWMGAGEKMLKKYGFTYLGYEQYPANTTNFAPIVKKVLSHKPEIVDFCGAGGAMGAVCGLITKQLRQGGYSGIIMMPTVPPPGIMQTVPKEYLTKIVTNDINIDSKIVTKKYRDLVNRYVKQYKSKPIDMMGQSYNGVSAFFAFLDGQKTMDTEAWVKGFENYKWKGVFGENARWLGQKIYGVKRSLVSNVWVSEYKNGKLETNFSAKIPYELFE